MVSSMASLYSSVPESRDGVTENQQLNGTQPSLSLLFTPVLLWWEGLLLSVSVSLCLFMLSSWSPLKMWQNIMMCSLKNSIEEPFKDKTTRWKRLFVVNPVYNPVNIPAKPSCIKSCSLIYNITLTGWLTCSILYRLNMCTTLICLQDTITISLQLSTQSTCYLTVQSSTTCSAFYPRPGKHSLP